MQTQTYLYLPDRNEILSCYNSEGVATLLAIDFFDPPLDVERSTLVCQKKYNWTTHPEMEYDDCTVTLVNRCD
jgi:hypothetical protein